MSTVHPVSDGLPPPRPSTYRWFPSWRLLTASLLCLCFASVHMMNSNMGMAVVCMVNSTEYMDDSITDASAAPKLNWTSEQEGYIFSAFNGGLLFMLLTGFIADKLNAKYMIVASVSLAVVANLLIAQFSVVSVYFAIGGRFLVGFADALLQPAVNSLLTRWFPTTERSYALGLATGGRHVYFAIGGRFLVGFADALLQPAVNSLLTRWFPTTERSYALGLATGTLIIIPVAGALCAQTTLFGGWPSIFYLSAAVGVFFVALYSAIGADKPSKQSCISDAEVKFITMSNANEDVGKKRTERKILNSIASLGLGAFLFAATLLDSTRAPLAVLFLCLSMASAGLHTPGCQTALVSLAPAYSGAITGFAFFFVACSGIVNPIMTKWIAQVYHLSTESQP
ncbi:unnamed protein product [Strongylus vulgaris]|uniref:Major facilitator superfamily (MFS) profile domain-containing protein n=1 Tax=Strongylus vulgaris TaxID=40348 RepID=A0A3P7L2E0_STRVU|nr:unnamed protein product [Strongylus vulgaris]